MGFYSDDGEPVTLSHSAFPTNHTIICRSARCVLAAFIVWQPFCSRFCFHRSQTPQTTAGQSVGPKTAYEIAVAKLNFRVRRKTALWYLIVTAAFMAYASLKSGYAAA